MSSRSSHGGRLDRAPTLASAAVRARPGGRGRTGCGRADAPAPYGARTLGVGRRRVDRFGTNPGNLAMYVYLPDHRPIAPALVVALHGCTQSAEDYLAHSGWRELADRDGFVLVLPEQRTTNNLNRCFNWFQESDIRRGSGE